MLVVYVDVLAHNGMLRLREWLTIGRKRRPSPLAIVRERLFLNSGSEGPLAIRDMRRFVNGGRRPRHTNLRGELSFPVPLINVQVLGAPEFFLAMRGKHARHC